jgi:hypothetical protein
MYIQMHEHNENFKTNTFKIIVINSISTPLHWVPKGKLIITMFTMGLA